MFIPNNKGRVLRQIGTDIYAQPVWGEALESVECGVVKLDTTAQPTSVRADSSASRANAEEFVSVAKILFLPRAYPAIGDKFEISGFNLRCMAVQPRFAVTGRLDHYECDFELWAAP